MPAQQAQIGLAGRPNRLRLPARFARSVSLNVTAMVVSGATTVVLTPFLLHHLGQDAFGVWVLAASVVGYLELLEFGFGSASTKLMAEDAGKRPGAVSETLSSTLAVLVVLGLVAGAVTAALAVGAPHWFHIPKGLDAATSAVFLALGLSLSLSIPGDAFGGGLAAYQRYDLRSISNMVLVVVTALATFVAVEMGGTLVAIAVIAAAVSVAMHPVRWLLLHRVDPAIRVNPCLVTRTRLRTVARFSGWFLLADSMSAVSYSVDVVIVGAALGIRDVAIYAIGAKLATLAQSALNQVSTVLLPEAASLGREGSHDEVRRLLLDGTRVTMLVGMPLALATGILARGAVRAWVGPGFDRAAVVLAIISIYAAMRTVVNPLESVIIGAGDVRRWSMAMALQGVINVAVTVALVSTVGLAGPALGTVAGTALVLLPAFVVLGCAAARCSVATFARGTVVPHVGPSLITAAVLLTLRRVAEQGRLEVIVVGAAGCGLYAAAYFMLGAAPEERALVARLFRRPGIVGRHYRQR